MRTREKRIIAFVVYPGIRPLDLVGPLSVLRDLQMATPYRTVVVGEHTEPMSTDTPLRLVAGKTFGEVPHPYGIVVPGSGEAIIAAMRNASILAYLRGVAETATLVGATGNGTLLLAAAGLLEGRRAAIHWAYGERLERLGVQYARERWVEDGKFLTAAGGSAGIDLMLRLVANLTGESRAKLTQITVEYDPQPPFGGIDWSSVEADLIRTAGPSQGT